MNTELISGDRTHRALLLLGIAGFIVYLPLALGGLLWMPVMLYDQQWLGSARAGLFIMTPALQLALLRHADNLHRRGRSDRAAYLLAGQTLTVAALAMWIFYQ